jgi:signal transduction histidine kinase
MQQSYSRLAGFTETVPLADIVEDALRLNQAGLDRLRIQVVRELNERGTVTLDKHKVLQILVNLIRNAKRACSEAPHSNPQIIVRTSRKDEERVLIEVMDNGVGIPHENLVRIFRQGFTTKKDGHGFGLHSSANAARELGGDLRVHSDGPGKGACFTLELPARQNAPSH